MYLFPPQTRRTTSPHVVKRAAGCPRVDLAQRQRGRLQAAESLHALQGRGPRAGRGVPGIEQQLSELFRAHELGGLGPQWRLVSYWVEGDWCSRLGLVSGV